MEEKSYYKTEPFSLTYDEMKQFVDLMNPPNYLRSIVIFLIAAIIVMASGGKDFPITNYLNLRTFIVLLAGIVVILVLTKPIRHLQMKKTFQRSAARYADNLEMSYLFYEDHFEYILPDSKMKFDYSKLSRIVETESNFYLMRTKRSGFIVVKSCCEPELIAFIQKLKTERNL